MDRVDRLSFGGKRRNLGRIGPSSLLGVPKKQAGAISHRFTSDTTSDVLHRSEVRYENTYKLPSSDNERFDTHRVEQVINNILESRLKDATYDRNSSMTLAKELADEIHRRVKDFQWKRYKLVCHVTVGQCAGQGVKVVSRCVWDTKFDNYSCVRYSNKNIFLVAQCFGVYFE